MPPAAKPHSRLSLDLHDLAIPIPPALCARRFAALVAGLQAVFTLLVFLAANTFATASDPKQELLAQSAQVFVLAGVDGRGVRLTNLVAATGQWVVPPPDPSRRILLPLQPHDQLRTRPESRAFLDSLDVHLTLDRDSHLEILLPPELPALYLHAGRLYYRSGGRQVHLRLQTPRTSTEIRGTEFQITVDPDPARGLTTLDLYNGQVITTSLDPNGRTLGSITAEVRADDTNALRTVVSPNQPPRTNAIPKLEARAGIQWALYYPGVLRLEDLPTSLDDLPDLAASLAAYRRGNLSRAVAEFPVHPPGWISSNPSEAIYWTALLLSVGDIDEATRILDTWDLRRESLPEGHFRRLADSLRQLIAAVTASPWQRGPRPLDPKDWLATECLVESFFQQLRQTEPTKGTLPLWLEPSTKGDSYPLARARLAALHAVANAPTFGFARARLAELEFSFGHWRQAEAELVRVLDPPQALSPDHAQAIALRGFVAAADRRWQDARKAFENAVALDPALGNAWFGRGLVRFHDNDSAGALADLQSAVLREPHRALLRSYLAKAYYETLRQQPLDSFAREVGDRFGATDATPAYLAKATDELALARELDPLDPTAWLYSSLIHRDANRINQAVHDLEESMRLNRNRSLYRSEPLLDQDQAVRGANLATIYADAGLRQWSVNEASRAVNNDYANYGAHLFLANSYDALRDPNRINLRYETPWLTEWLLAQLLAPVGAGSLSTRASQQEYSPLFDRDRMGLRSSTTYRSDRGWQQSGSVYGHQDRFGWAVDTFYRNHELDAPNTDQDFVSLSTQAKWQFSPAESLWMQIQYSHLDAGDPARYYDPGFASTTQRILEEQNPNLFTGYHREWSPTSHTLILVGLLRDRFFRNDSKSAILYSKHNNKGLATAVYQLPWATNGLALRNELNNAELYGAGIDFDTSYHSILQAYSGEIQHLWQSGRHTWIAGARWQQGSTEVANRVESLVPFSAYSIYTNYSVSQELHRVSAYLYDQLEILEPLRMTFGLAYDSVHYPANTEIIPVSDQELTTDRLSPKAGIEWTVGRSGHVRAMYSRSVGGVYYDTSFRLEPAQIAGFGQAFRSLAPESVVGLLPGSEFNVAGWGGDAKIGLKTYLSLDAQWLRSDAERHFGTVETLPRSIVKVNPSFLRQSVDYEERNIGVQLQHLASDRWSFGVAYQIVDSILTQRFDDALPAASVVSLTSQDLKLDPAVENEWTSLLHQVRLSTLLQDSTGFYVQGEAIWYAQLNDGYPTWINDEAVWILNLFFGYRFPARLAEARLAFLNLTGQDYRIAPLSVIPDLPRDLAIELSLRFAW